MFFLPTTHYYYNDFFDFVKVFFGTAGTRIWRLGTSVIELSLRGEAEAIPLFTLSLRGGAEAIPLPALSLRGAAEAIPLSYEIASSLTLLAMTAIPLSYEIASSLTLLAMTTIRRSFIKSLSAAKFCTQNSVHHLRVCTATGFFHHCTNKRAERLFFTAPVFFNGDGVFFNNLIYES